MDIKNTRFTVLLIILGVSSVLFAAGIPDPQWNPGYDHGAARKNNTYTKAEVDDSLAEVMRTDGTNADSPVFPGAVTVTGQFTANAGAEFLGTVSAVKILGNPAAPVTSVDGKGSLDIWGEFMTVGAEAGTNTRSNNQVKRFRLAVAHFSNAEQPFCILRTGAANGISGLLWGGGDPALNAATEHIFFTAANSTTLYGAEVMRMTSSQQLLIATSTAAVDSAVKLKLNGGMEISPGGFLLVGTDTRQVGYGATIASGCYVQGDVSADQFTDRSDAPADLAEAYAIIQSHEAKDGKVDHSKLHAAAWGRKFRVVETGKTLIKTREIAPAEEGGKATIEEYSEPEKVVVSEPDQQGRNLSMVISAQALVIADLTRRLEALEAR